MYKLEVECQYIVCGILDTKHKPSYILDKQPTN